MSDRGTSRVEIKNGDNPDYVNDYTSLVSEEVFEEIFEGLANKLTKKTFYKCQIDDEKIYWRKYSSNKWGIKKLY